MSTEKTENIIPTVDIPEGEAPKNAIPVIKFRAKSKNTGNFHDLETRISSDGLSKFKSNPVQFGEELLKDVTIGGDFNLIAFGVDYKSEDYTPPDKSMFNTKVEVNIPYCLHLPNGYSCNINKQNNNCEAYIEFWKVWTENAMGSSMCDVFAKDAITYYANYEIGNFQFPQKPEEGWQIKVDGKNIEKAKDNTGHFRYTKMILKFNTDLWNTTGTEEKVSKEKAKVVDTVIAKTRNYVFRILDVYRYVTKEEYIERTNNINITDILFITNGEGFYPYKDGYGISIAVMNRKGSEIAKIKELLENNVNLELHELLLLNSKSAFNKGSYSLSVLEASQALEVFLEGFLVNKFKNMGVSEKDINDKLENDNNWKIKNRLKDLLQETTGHKLSENQKLWDKWCTLYDNVRHPLIHKGKLIPAIEAKETLEANEEVIKWITSLP